MPTIKRGREAIKIQGSDNKYKTHTLFVLSTAVAWLCVSAQMQPCSLRGQGHERVLSQ